MTSTIESDHELGRALAAKRLQLRIKRVFDVIVSLTGLILLAPILLTTAMLVRLSSPGPVIFRQQRHGFQGQVFLIWKFRSMRAQQDETLREAERAAAAEGRLLKLPNDPRVTRIGRILRMSSLDELPQLFNVLKGEMSFVGPRPLVPLMLEPYPEFRRARALLRPGITGLWQIRDRENNTSALSMMHHDLEYAERFSLVLDAAILLGTLRVVLSRKGAC